MPLSINTAPIHHEHRNLEKNDNIVIGDIENDCAKRLLVFNRISNLNHILFRLHIFS